MADDQDDEPVRAGMAESEMRENVIRLAFDGDPAKLDAFCDVVRQAIPDGTRVVLRGSSVTGVRWEDGAPFDADGPGSSDLDLTLCGAEVLKRYAKLGGFDITGVHSKPISEKAPEIAPDLLPLRQALMDMVKRPVNIQGTRNWIMYVREHVMRQPYLILIDGDENDGADA